MDELYRHHQPFNPQGNPFNLAPLICGSEGTFSVIKQATLNLVELPKYRQLICGHFESVEAVSKVVPRLLEFNPAAIELIDKATLDGAKSNRQQQQNRFWIEGDPLAVLVIELFDEEAESLKTRLQIHQAWLNQVSNEERKVLLHVHCHQKSLATPMDHRKALELISGITVEMMPTGCCGMSGDFGYKHYVVSKKIAEKVLLPRLALVHFYSSAKAYKASLKCPCKASLKRSGISSEALSGSWHQTASGQTSSPSSLKITCRCKLGLLLPILAIL